LLFFFFFFFELELSDCESESSLSILRVFLRGSPSESLPEDLEGLEDLVLFARARRFFSAARYVEMALVNVYLMKVVFCTPSNK
jgi:hypothetical protein